MRPGGGLQAAGEGGHDQRGGEGQQVVRRPEGQNISRNNLAKKLQNSIALFAL